MNRKHQTPKPNTPKKSRSNQPFNIIHNIKPQNQCFKTGSKQPSLGIRSHFFQALGGFFPCRMIAALKWRKKMHPTLKNTSKIKKQIHLISSRRKKSKAKQNKTATTNCTKKQTNTQTKSNREEKIYQSSKNLTTRPSRTMNHPTTLLTILFFLWKRVRWQLTKMHWCIVCTNLCSQLTAKDHWCCSQARAIELSQLLSELKASKKICTSWKKTTAQCFNYWEVAWCPILTFFPPLPSFDFILLFLPFQRCGSHAMYILSTTPA